MHNLIGQFRKHDMQHVRRRRGTERRRRRGTERRRRRRRRRKWRIDKAFSSLLILYT